MNYPLISMLTILLLIQSSITRAQVCDDVWIKEFNPQALEKCKQVAESGNVEAQFEYGLWLVRAPSEYKNIPKAIIWLKMSAQNKHYLSQVALGKFLSGEIESDQLPINPVESYAWYMTANEVKAANRIKAKMSYKDKKKAEELAASYIEKYQSDETRNNH
ncbi:MAG: hypothetical protein P8171_14620 [Candidatus Thiodiazotropha sp.]